MVSTSKELGIVLNFRPSAEGNKARRVLFYLELSFATLSPKLFALTTFWECYSSNPIILDHDKERLEEVQTLIVKFTNGFKHAQYYAALQRLRFLPLALWRIPGALIPTLRAAHSLLEFPMKSVFTHPTHPGQRWHTYKLHQQRCSTRRPQHVFNWHSQKIVGRSYQDISGAPI